jgi:hypothetical protein
LTLHYFFSTSRLTDFYEVFTIELQSACQALLLLDQYLKTGTLP